ncbi:hypothetical protein DY000_02052712 [Brassica cretica]|uniref:Uncharacterized protein n=1 Tax=Brassica cretica TaxID=69181 RepID=A0ABQ7ACL2_BRACR|nr:hypothetical protein DY000_02052712 [Brassica cretica]
MLVITSFSKRELSEVGNALNERDQSYFLSFNLNGLFSGTGSAIDRGTKPTSNNESSPDHLRVLNLANFRRCLVWFYEKRIRVNLLCLGGLWKTECPFVSDIGDSSHPLEYYKYCSSLLGINNFYVQARLTFYPPASSVAICTYVSSPSLSAPVEDANDVITPLSVGASCGSSRLSGCSGRVGGRDVCSNRSPSSQFLVRRTRCMPSRTRSNKETQLLFSSDPASLEHSIRKGIRSSSIDHNNSSSLDSRQPPSTHTPVSSTDTRSPLSTEDTLPSTDIFHPTSIDTLVRGDKGDLYDQEGHLRNAAG